MIKTIKYIVCCLVGVFTLLPIQAQNIIRPKIAGPGNLWVNSYNGVLFFGQTDFETQNSAMPMQLRFFYNSSASAVDYGYGLGFSMGYEIRYYEDVIGGVDIETGDGRTDHFAKYGDEYKAPAGVFSTLVRPTFDTYLMTTKDGTKYFFDNAHHRKVTAIEDRNGNRTTFKYQDTLLVEVKDAVGHTITLSYTDGLMTQASATFSPGKFKYEYDGLRRLRKRIDPLGNVTLYDYSRQNKLDEIIDANGNKTLIAYNNSGMVSRMKTDVSDKSIRYDGDKTVFIDYTEPNNVYSYYSWDDKGRAIEKVGLCCGIQSTIKYDDNDNVAQLIDANGNATNYSYDEFGNMLSLNDPHGYTEQYTYETNFNQIAFLKDKNGNGYYFNYDSKGNLISLEGPLGLNYYYSYDDHGWQTMASDPNGGVTRKTYNNDGTTASVINPDGGIFNYIYDSYGRLISMTDPMNNIISYEYDALGRITSQKDALGNITSVSYDKVGNIVRIMNAAGHISSYTYNQIGNVTSITNEMGYTTSYEYDGRGNVIAEIDPQGVRREATYNENNLIESYTNGLGEKSYYDYDQKGNIVSIIQPNGNVVSCEWNELDRISEISDNIGLIASFEYDANGNCISVIDGLNRKMDYSFDALNRRISESFPNGSKKMFTYDSNSNLTSVTDQAGHVTSYTYDAMNRQTSYTDALGANTRYTYDVNGNMTRIIDANGNATAYAYNAMNNITAVIFANGQSLQYNYDVLNRIVRTKDRAGNDFKYSYNHVGDLLSKTYPDGSTDKYTYDANGRMLSAINKNATVIFTYDSAGRLLSETLNGKKTAYSYDIAAGKRIISYPSGVRVVENLNARDLISSILLNGTEVVSMEYNVSGQIISKTYANGINTSYGYNDNGWLKSIKDDKDVISLVMSYDANGNITKRENLLDYSRTENYGYDLISQLSSFSSGSINKSWEYDLLGNRVKTIENGVITTYRTNNINAYTSITGSMSFSPQYDDNGNLTENNDHHYLFDFNNQMIEIVDENTSFTYDALRRRISNGNKKYYYVGNQMVEMENGEQISSFIYGNNIDEALIMRRNDNLYYYHSNHLGSTLALSDKNGNLIETVAYDPFGTPTFIDNSGSITLNSSVDNVILFAGREYDEKSGNYYFRMRNYEQKTGRFMQHDPLIYVDGYNDYIYANNNCVLFNDPFGLSVGGVGGVGGFGNNDPYNYRNQTNSNAEQASENYWKKKGKTKQFFKKIIDKGKEIWCEVDDFAEDLNDTNTDFYGDLLHLSDDARKWMKDHPYKSLGSQALAGLLAGLAAGGVTYAGLSALGLTGTATGVGATGSAGAGGASNVIYVNFGRVLPNAVGW